jgi:O-antigen ligase
MRPIAGGTAHALGSRSIRGHGEPQKYPPTTAKRSRWRSLQTWIPISLVVVAACASTLDVVYWRFGELLLTAMCGLAFASPFSGLALVSASQLVPDPDWSIGLSISELVFIGWAFNAAVRLALGQRIRLPTSAIILLVPVTAWAFVASMTHQDFYVVAMLSRDVLYLVLVYDLYVRAKRNVRLCTLALLGGCSVAAFGYWAFLAGFDLAVFRADPTTFMQDFSRGWLRTEFGRTDANTVAVNISAVLAGLAAAIVSDRESGSQGRKALARLGGLAVAAILGALMLPALAATMSRGGLAELAAGLAVVLLYVLAGPTRSRSGHRINAAWAGGAFVLAACVLAATPYGRESIERIIDVGRYTSDRGGLVTARGVTLQGVLETAALAPAFGISYQQFVDTYGKIPHSSFFDVMVSSGLPGLLFFSACALWPLALAVRRRVRDEIYLPVFVAYVCFLVYATTISALSNKAFWCLWLLCLLNASGRGRYVRMARTTPPPLWTGRLAQRQSVA